MSRGRQRKSSKGLFSEAAMKNAVHDVIINHMSLRNAAERNNVKFQTLARYVKKQKISPNISISMKPKYDTRRVFSNEQEHLLVDYILQCSKMCYGKSTKDVRKLAFELAVANKIHVPQQWEINKRAGVDWLNDFIKRHPNISIRQPEGCSLSRATSFNPHNVNTFFGNLECVMQRCDSFADGSRVYNLDETATTTVQRSSKIIAQKGAKQVSKCTSAERGTLVTTCCIINALGNTVPPAMVFPRKFFKNHMIQGAPPGTLGLANPSGWMTSELFVEVIKHFVKHTLSSVDRPTLLIMDNHESHLSIDCINLAKVTLLTLPPHCSNKLQPLDVSVYFAFKAFYNAAIDSWMLRHPGIPLTIYQVAECVGTAFEKSVTQANIRSGFKKSGIFPLDKNIFSEDDFLISSVTDRETPSTWANMDEADNCDREVDETDNSQKIINTNLENKTQQISDLSANKGENGILGFVSPRQLLGYPKAAPRKILINSRRKKSSKIVTDTPEKIALEEKQKEKERKNSLKKAKSTKRTLSKQLASSDSDDEENAESFVSDASSDRWDPLQDLDNHQEFLGKPEKDSYVLVKFTKKVFYIGKILQIQENVKEYEISFLRRGEKNRNCFVFPSCPDICMVKEADIQYVLPPPSFGGATKRQNRFLKFDINFSSTNLDVR